jgi:malate dehydrogenase (quinone)
LKTFAQKQRQNLPKLKKKNNKWNVKVRNEENNNRHILNAPFVFIGAGGGSLPLLLKSNIPESKGFGGFPVSGQWLRCTNKEVIERHSAKVYGTAAVGSPPMSVPHLDTGWIKGSRELLFGPYAGFTSFSDQVNSPEWQNKLKEMIPSHGRPLGKDAALTRQVRAYTGKVLGLQQPALAGGNILQVK